MEIQNINARVSLVQLYEILGVCMLFLLGLTTYLLRIRSTNEFLGYGSLTAGVRRGGWISPKASAPLDETIRRMRRCFSDAKMVRSPLSPCGIW